MTGRHTRLIVLTVLATVVLSMASCASQDPLPQEPPPQEPSPQEPSPQEPSHEEIENLGIDDLRAQAEQGNALAQSYLGLRYESGLGVVKNETEAVRWYVLAADQGEGVAKDIVEALAKRGNQDALKWIFQAAKRGDVKAQYSLGVFYAFGSSAPQNFAEAYHWLLLAAEQGYVPAQFSLGRLYEGAEGNQVDAHAWFNIASARETSDDQTVLRDDGVAVTRDETEHNAWIDSIGGSRYASIDVSRLELFTSGALTPAEPVYVYSSTMRDRVARDMTPNQIAEAERLALAWESRQRQPSEP